LAGLLEGKAQKLRGAAAREQATLLLSIDQAEELTYTDNPGGDALADYLTVALDSDLSSWQLAMTIRTDSFPEFQRNSRFKDLKARGYDLRPVRAFHFDNIVEEPAKRY